MELGDEVFDPVEAAAKVAARSLPENGILTHAERFQDLGLPVPDLINDPVTAGEIEFEAVKRWSEVKTYLLTQHKLAFANVTGVGYRRVPAEDQAEWGRKTALTKITKAIDFAVLVANNVRTDDLSDAQRSEAANISAKLSQHRQMITGRRKRGW